MYRLLLEDEEFKALDLPLTEEKHTALEYVVGNGLCHEPVIVWQDRIIDGYERYQLYQRYHRPYSVKEESFTNRNQVIVWICQHQLARHDLNTNAEAWILSRMHTAKCSLETGDTASDNLSARETRTNIQNQICRDRHISEASLRRYVAFGKYLDRMEEKHPGVRTRILTGDLKVAREHMKELLAMPADDLQRMIDNPNCQKLLPPKPKKRMRGLSLFRMNAPICKPQTGIKQMPAYDPDAELNGMTFTVSSWGRTVSRVREKTDFQAATPEGKQRLQQALTGLMAEVNELNQILEVASGE